MTTTTRFETDVVIIGGGATGTGIMRDCALRGIACILLEKDDIASGTTGRNHGLLHSGARYAVTDPESAKECIQENQILKNIARHCVEKTDGLFITLPEDDLAFQSTFIDACAQAGITTEPLSAKEALRLEPHVNPNLVGAIKVPDGTLDPFRLCASNVLDAKEHGARIMNKTIVTSLIRQGDTVLGVRCLQLSTHQQYEIFAKEVINAAGIWGQNICEYADLNIKMFPAKGSLLILDYRINNLVINRCRKPSDADILVPGDTISLIGTTSEHIDYDQIDNLHVTEKEVDILLAEGAKLAPIMANTRVLRAYAGVRPLVSINDDGSGRNISRGIVLLDHEQRDGLKGLTTITGGKLMTYRLMAEWATDLVAKKLGNNTPCETHTRALPGSNETPKQVKKTASIAKPVYESAIYRHGERAQNFLSDDAKSQAVICECEMVTAGEIEYAIKQLDVNNLIDLRRRTRLGMGPCQGELCSYRAASLFQEYGHVSGNQSSQLLVEFLEERWKGIKPIFWGDALREAEFSYWIYEGLFGANDIPTQHKQNESEETL
ncbi:MULTISPECIES: anaerobic glycerol-3-phosphate dehydrogenase subunit A [unclassified Vibrio]|uniref:anaerobic glycerol-3-phosphate dehydrogenase subunit A n=1 Tax=unclassified Vibrio TaxID=2614977 RepID=UPI000B8E6135|nr:MULTISPECIES: anaerobic glycerol-3-phosphate dehydrogenase subunit A [unclassified Vibrio]NAW90162.1 anaerobic glycerol-3-phosphate dehydrogenase subunit A [Vibrio sp. V24_P1S3T111]OXX25930.1 sn-glycerol-3-phosphate dehydrogenase subunit A [Vibrio sp. V06_P1A73T115]OXX27454.1 sn-glycerol-3-phosphate dehydrogenase subunit A [Vibrio sp. V05_P4A8T149]OXX31035.1 sn-glycerol-3-phosphate dehydrogenase subunit A [Vibrio sp. V14_P6S14T42]OXX35721.1 sn-glycerol-3-phosphate dehydrogenase subunit A [V